ncbi:MAG TPA: OFA family MFS transporter [Bacilli bacterium]|nr:OFA family MFS transporter [Bacilli bacterium]
MKENKWLNGALPAILIHGSIGSVYAWSTLAPSIANRFGKSDLIVQIAFSLAIFFLGMSAAFGGRLVERNIHVSSRVSLGFFCGGLLLTALSIHVNSIALFYLGYGAIMGIGLGTGYLTPVKTLMLWFKDNKGLATGIAVCAFGFANTIAAWLNNYLINHYSLEQTFIYLAIIYLIPMFIASWLLKKPSWWKEDEVENSNFKMMSMWKDKNFRKIWLVMFINIASGLALISVAKTLMINTNTEHPNSVQINPVLVVSIMGIFNGLGRLVIATISDKLKKRIDIYRYITMFEALAVIFTIGKTNPAITFIALCVIAAGYGAGFSCLPSLLSDIYGSKNISKIHGLSLTSWAIAGLVGPIFISNVTNYTTVATTLYVVYIVAEWIAERVKYVNYTTADQEK